jgi:ubiquinol-cytochrome c reductase cytochrome c subunit
VRAPIALARTLALAIAFAGAACSYFVEEQPSPYRPPGVTSEVRALGAGRTLYERDCAWCHGSAGQGTTFGPDLNGPLDGGAYTHFMLVTGRMPLGDPTERAVPGPPRYGGAQLDAIVAYVETFGGTGPDIPAPVPTAGDLADGAELYLENCAACHSATAAGGALTSGEVVPDLHHTSPVVLAEAMLVGPGCPNTSPTCGPGEGAMPRFELDEHEVDSIVRYVLYLQRPDDEGGAPIGRVGPVSEGAVALGLGLLALLLASRWIGTRTRPTEKREHG